MAGSSPRASSSMCAKMLGSLLVVWSVSMITQPCNAFSGHAGFFSSAPLLPRASRTNSLRSTVPVMGKNYCSLLSKDSVIPLSHPGHFRAFNPFLPLGSQSLRQPSFLRAEASEEGGSSAPAADSQELAEMEDEDEVLSGQPGAVDALREEMGDSRTVTPARLAKCFSFPLDDFQMASVTALIEKRSVVVSAPTGSGKTVCGEAAVYLGMALKKRVMYTTPLKALSNQKFNDFCKQFGPERVGLLTGDISINRENASVLVLTTEVYRNMLYDKEERSVRDVHSVILDEFHYMNDRDRGTVWETMRNVNDIRDWFEHVHGPTGPLPPPHRRSLGHRAWNRERDRTHEGTHRHTPRTKCAGTAKVGPTKRQNDKI